MHKYKWICLVTVGLTAIMGTASADEAARQSLASGIRQFYGLDSSDVEVQIRSSRIEFEESDFDSLTLEPLTRTEPRGLVTLKITAFKAGQKVGADQVRAFIAWYENVLVSTVRIGRHDEISPEKFTLKRMEITSLTDRPLTSDDNLSGVWALRNISRDQILTSSMVETIPPILVGQGISIRFISGALEVMARGTALQEGHIGEQIRVRNSHTKKTITCMVLDAETVQVVN